MSGWSDIRSSVAGQRDALVESLQRPDEKQLQLLRRIIERNCDTEFGKRYGFRSVRTIADYQRRVPLHSYDDFRSDIHRMMAGEKNVLCADDVLLFEQTGGSTGGSKFLPFTEASLKAIRRAVLPWLDDLLTSRAGIPEGKAYWAISPATRQQSQTSGGIPIGIDNDAAYFGADLAQAIGRTLAVPASVASIRSLNDWRLATLCHLLACRDLSFVSVWSPTFLLQLLDAIPDDVERIATAVETGSLSLSETVAGRKTFSIKADRERAAELRVLFAAQTVRWESIWPMLDTISCWCSSSSRRYAKQVAERFPKTSIQGKGLLATEGVVTVPLVDAHSPVLAVDSGFYEFESDSGEIVLPWELETEQTYSVLLTTEAGLYRYRLGDRVIVNAWYGATPCLEYVGREGGGSDLCGEKLTEEFVEAALGEIPGFGFLVPIAQPRPSYLLMLDAAIVNADEEENSASLADRRLMQNPQYRYAREIGQLPPLAPHRITDPLGMYKCICVRSGQRLGDIKPSVLASAGWGERFRKAKAP